MEKKERIEAYRKFYVEWGCGPQENVAIEEMSELIKAIMKNRRTDSNETMFNIWEEIADCLIMLEQLCYMYEISDEWLESQMEYKIERALDLL
jgi:MazG nucleotide pyrophosphohydrolase domain.